MVTRVRVTLAGCESFYIQHQNAIDKPRLREVVEEVPGNRLPLILGGHLLQHSLRERGGTRPAYDLVEVQLQL